MHVVARVVVGVVVVIVVVIAFVVVRVSWCVCVIVDHVLVNWCCLLSSLIFLVVLVIVVCCSGDGSGCFRNLCLGCCLMAVV